MKEILVSPDVNALELLDLIHKDLTSKEIVVFTPKGEQKTVEKTSTALDFAYQIHTEIGNKAIAAKVNMRLVPLSHTLKSGDTVEIITAENEHPKREWLQFLTTRHARSIVVDYFKGQKKEFAETGKKMLSDQLEKIGYRMNDDAVTAISEHYGIQARNPEDLFFYIGLGTVKLNDLGTFMSSDAFSGGKISKSWSFPWFRKTKDKEEEKKDKKSEYAIATCCRPIPGDPVIGIKSPDGVITVHKKTCPVAESIASKHGDWVVVPQWDGAKEDAYFPVRLNIKGVDRVGLLNEISRFISLVMGVNMKKIYFAADEGIFEGYIELEVRDKSVLERMIRRLGSIEGVQSVQRADI